MHLGLELFKESSDKISDHGSVDKGARPQAAIGNKLKDHRGVTSLGEERLREDGWLGSEKRCLSREGGANGTRQTHDQHAAQTMWRMKLSPTKLANKELLSEGMVVGLLMVGKSMVGTDSSPVFFPFCIVYARSGLEHQATHW